MAAELLAWLRPADVPSPAVWGRHEHDGTRYRVQEATPELHEKMLAFYVAEYFHDEPAAKNIGLPDDEVSVAEFVFLISTALCQGSSLVALEEGGAEPEIVGAMIIPVLSKDDPELPEFHGQGTQTLLGLSKALRDASPYGHPFTRPSGAEAWRGPVPLYAIDLGLWVRRDRRRRGLGLALLKAVPTMCRAFGIPHFTTLFTGAASQVLAFEAGFKEMSRIKYADVKDAEGRPAFRDMPEVECILMGMDMD